jgi:Fe2+ transport system protein FeoA
MEYKYSQQTTDNGQKSTSTSLAEMETGTKCVIVKVNGHGGLRHRLMELGFVKGETVTVIKNAPLQDPVASAPYGSASPGWGLFQSGFRASSAPLRLFTHSHLFYKKQGRYQMSKDPPHGFPCDGLTKQISEYESLYDATPQ